MNEAGKHGLLLTGDQSHTLVSDRFGVTYHSRHGAIGESRHVFIGAGLLDFLAEGPPVLRILEVGFGTGLNALLVRQLAAAHPATRFHYTAFEKYPLADEVVGRLNYAGQLGLPQEALLDLHRKEVWAGAVRLDPNFTLTVYQMDFLDPAAPGRLTVPQDVLFFDAFAPASQPELWEPAVLARCYSVLRPGGVLTTYCAQGQFKRDLRAVGFSVAALPGPPGKREMTRARRLS